LTDGLREPFGHSDYIILYFVDGNNPDSPVTPALENGHNAVKHVLHRQIKEPQGPVGCRNAIY